jgi:GTP-binding protein
MAHSAEFYRSFSNAGEIPSDNRAQIAFAGRSNVGKSSLLNRLAGQKKLARTSKTPGRTRLINLFLIDNSFYFVDLPGYGYAKASKADKAAWGRLVENFFQRIGNLKGLVLLLDCRRDPSEDDMTMIDWLESSGVNYMIALTKADKLSRSRLIQKQKQVEKAFSVEVIPFSTLSGIGRNEIWAWIDRAVNDHAK